MRVLLVSMPWAPPNASSQLGVLKAHLESRSNSAHTTRTAHLHVHLAAALGLDTYELLSDTGLGTQFANLCFQSHLFGRADRSLAEWLPPEIWQSFVEYTDGRTDLLNTWKEAIDTFVAALPSMVAWDEADVVGFSCVFDQLFAALVAARVVKQVAPKATVVFGGVEVYDSCGRSVLEQFPEVDFVIGGRGEQPFEHLLDALQAREDPRMLAGVGGRDAGGTCFVNPPAACPKGISALVPDYAEYFETAQRLGSYRSFAVQPLPLEGSIGCHWGKCDFCGSAGISGPYRAQSAEVLAATIDTLAARHDAWFFLLTDEQLHAPHLGRALALLNEHEEYGRHLNIAGQVRASIHKDHLRRLAEGGLRVVQLGVESLSTSILQHMDKGITALENIRCIRWCMEFSIAVDYNIIVNYPFAKAQDLTAMEHWVPRLTHLTPPKLSSFYVNRFSPLYRSGRLQAAGIQVQPSALYNTEIFAEPLSRMNFVALDMVRPTVLPEEDRLLAAFEQWRRVHKPNQFYMLPSKHRLLLRDDRRGDRRTIWLAEPARSIYLYCDDIRSRDDIGEQFPDLPAEGIDGFLAQSVAEGLMLVEQDRYLSLAVRYPGRIRTT